MVRTIILIGPPGSGKTSSGQALAKLLGWTFVDTDRLIEGQAGMSIPEIFSGYGEGYFRQLERDLLESLSGEETAGRFERFVIGTGGGLPVGPGNFELLSRIGEVVCLRATIEELVARLHGQGGRRPLLASASPHGAGEEGRLGARLEQILSDRQMHYGRARYTVETTGVSADEVAGRIVKLLNL